VTVTNTSTLPATAAVDTCDVVVVGGTGDLAMRKLLPALLHRDLDGQLTDESRIISCSVAGLDDDGYRAKVLDQLHRFVPEAAASPGGVNRFLARLHHRSVDALEPNAWGGLADLLRGHDDRVRVFYLACTPALFGSICQGLATAELAHARSRLVVEKPLGSDLESARAIHEQIGSVFDESQIFRIDHYLGKETVQNLAGMRFANIWLEPLWNSGCVDHVQITVAEGLGVEDRADYYDPPGRCATWCRTTCCSCSA